MELLLVIVIIIVLLMIMYALYQGRQDDGFSLKNLLRRLWQLCKLILIYLKNIFVCIVDEFKKINWSLNLPA